MSCDPILRSAVRPGRHAALIVAALLVTSLTFAVSGQGTAAADDGDTCLGDPATAYTVTRSGNDASGAVTFTAPGSPAVTADYTLTTAGLVGHPSVDVTIVNRNRFGDGIEYVPQMRANLGTDWGVSRFSDAVTATFDVEVDAEGSAARVRLVQVLGDRGGNSEASTYTVTWDGPGVAVVSDPVVVDAVYVFGAPASGAPDAFAAANGEIEDLKTGDTLASGDSFVVYATKNSLSEWSVEFPAGARNIRVEKVALSGATHAQGALQAADRDDPAQGRDVQLPRYGVFTGPGGAADAAPGQTYLEFLAFQVLFVAAECIPAVVEEETVAPSAPSLSCTPQDPSVGETVTCQVTGGDPDIDILWRAAAGDVVIASTGVRLGSDGTGTFSFVVPATALGQALTVELVEWTQPMTLGVVGGPVPASVPAGEGSVPFGAVLLALFAAAGALFAGRRLVTAG